MGWWKEEDGSLIGDDPLDLLSEAFHGVVDRYEERCHRKPSLSEWQYLVAGALQGVVLDSQVDVRDGVITGPGPEQRLVVKLSLEDVH